MNMGDKEIAFYAFWGVAFAHRWWSGVNLLKSILPELIHHDSKTQKDRIEKCPSLKNYNPSPYYVFDYHGQLQTVVQCILRASFRLLFSGIKYRREIFTLRDSATIGLDWAYVEGQPTLPDNAPIIIIMHGLCGDSMSEYVVHLVEKALERGYKAVVVVARGCSTLKLTTSAGFTGARTDDYEQSVEHIHERFPNAELFGLGFSLGAGILLKYLGVQPRSPLLAAVSVSPPWNYHVTPKVFSWWSMLFVQSLKVYFLQHMYALSKDLSILSVLMAKDITAFDTISIQTYGYNSVEEYYTDASACRVSHHITIPTLAISAADDPVCCVTGCPDLHPNPSQGTDGTVLIPGQVGPGLVVVKTNLGGHLGFAEGLLPFRDSWVDEVALEWFAAIRNENKK
eukprot:gene2809-5527_t